ncbi:hypothetical protein EOD15_35225, partial [Mesorhizobium sp. M7A.T.Ca.US.000.02.2.1]
AAAAAGSAAAAAALEPPCPAAAAAPPAPPAGSAAAGAAAAAAPPPPPPPSFSRMGKYFSSRCFIVAPTLRPELFALGNCAQQRIADSGSRLVLGGRQGRAFLHRPDMRKRRPHGQVAKPVDDPLALGGAVEREQHKLHVVAGVEIVGNGGGKERLAKTFHGRHAANQLVDRHHLARKREWRAAHAACCSGWVAACT